MMVKWNLLVFTACLVQCNANNVTIGNSTRKCEPSWMFKCVPHKGCQRSSNPQRSNITASNEFFNIDLCRTVCGNFGGIWPKPVTATLSLQTVNIHPNSLKYHIDDVPVEARYLLNQMILVTTQNLLDECGNNETELIKTPVVVYIAVKSARLVLSWATNEEYMLEVQTKEDRILVHILAETVYGARHGLETFSQLTSSDMNECEETPQCSLRLVSRAKVRDRPVFAHRGLLLDTSRHFIPMKDIRRTLDGMAASKLNVFHWHITDAQSFPMESTRVPQFTLYGAYSSTEIYGAEEIKDLINYAQIRGIRVVIEIYVPAHASNGWQWGKDAKLGDLAVCVTAHHWRQLCIQPPCGQLNPANPEMYRILKELYRDVADYLLDPPLLHMGGDELWSNFHKKALLLWDEVLAEAGKKNEQSVMLWSSELTHPDKISMYLDKDRYIIEVWEDIESSMLTRLLEMGYRAVSAPKDIWYLDHGFWGSTKYSNWRRMYAHKLPGDHNLLGGEVAMWTEYVDENVLDTRVWPRAAAVAERLWADPSEGGYAAEPRLQRLRSRMISRGLRPDALSPGWCTQNEFSWQRSRAHMQFRAFTSVERLCFPVCVLIRRVFQ